MRTDVRFNVHGESRDELIDRATALYREYIGDPAATLPHSTEIEASLDSESIFNGDGEEIVETHRWTGQVVIVDRVET